MCPPPDLIMSNPPCAKDVGKVALIVEPGPSPSQLSRRRAWHTLRNRFAQNPGLYLIDIETGFETAIAALPSGFSSGLDLAWED